MTTLIVSLTTVLAIAGIGVVIWSLINTRKKYFNEYMDRKRND